MLSIHLDYVLANGVTTCQETNPVESMTPSYSLIHSLEEGFQVNMFTCTNNNTPKNFILHQSMSVKLILIEGMCVIFNCLFAEAKTREDFDGRHLGDRRFYSTVVGNGA